MVVLSPDNKSRSHSDFQQAGSKMQRSKSMTLPSSPNANKTPKNGQRASIAMGQKSAAVLPPIRKGGKGNKDAPPGEDISPHLAMHMRRSYTDGFGGAGMSPTRSISSGALGGGQLKMHRSFTASMLGDEDDEHPPNEETQHWMHSVMATMTKKTRKSYLQPLQAPDAETDATKEDGAGPTEGYKAAPTAVVETAQDSGPAEEKSGEGKVKVDGDPNGIPDPESVLRRFAGGQGFDKGELTRMRATFNRFKVPDTVDVHKDDLPEILSRLGYMMVVEEDVRSIADITTIYSTLDFNEFVGLVEKFSDFELGKFKVMFDSFDEDASGNLSTEETQRLMSVLGFTPLKSMIKEALDIVDKDKSGQMDFGEFIHLQAIYRSTEGFTSPEVACLESIYKEECGTASCLPAEKLRDVLLHFCGPQSIVHVEQLAKEVLVSSRKDADESDTTKPPMLHFPEVMIWARRLREIEFDNYRIEFKKQDRDGSGFIDMDEIQRLIADLGFTLSKRIVQEFINMVDDDWTPPDEEVAGSPHKEKDNKLDFDEFVNLMLLLRDTDGFTRPDLADFKKTFARFDDDKSGDVDVLELSDMMRYLGHNSSLDEVHQLIAKVDFNDSGSLDFREFVRLLRQHREGEVKGIKQAFEKAKDGASGLVPAAGAKQALEDCGVNIPDEDDKKKSKKGSQVEFNMPEGDLDFDSFVEVVDALRAIRVAEGRRRAGFSTSEIDRFRKMFAQYDADHSGLIDSMEVANLLIDLGFKLRTKEERDNVLGQVDKARQAAEAVGVETGPDKGSVGFWVLVQLLRVLYNRDDKRILDREAHAAEHSRFSTHEIEEFREVFLNWWSHEKNFEDEEEANKPNHDDAEPEVEPDCKEISKDGMRRLLRQLGCNLTHDQRAELEAKVSELDQVNHNGVAHVDFASFLRLMRWMLDTNFADINKHTSKATH
jgi:Ca2+-binding EF-hand superfamily protein